MNGTGSRQTAIGGRMSRRRLVRGTALAGLGAAFAAACGGGAKKEEATGASSVFGTTGTPASVGAPAAAAQVGKPGGTIRWVMMAVDPTSFDPYGDFNYQSHLSTLFYYSRLYRFRTLPDKPGSFWDYEAATDAAQAMPEITDGGQTYLIKLRPDAKWQNLPPMNGRLMTSEDVKFDIDFFIQNAQSRDVLAVVGPGLTSVILVLGITGASRATRVTRGATIGVRENTYVEGARVVGAGDVRIMTRYVLPNILAIVMVLATVELGGFILAEATISFLGYGVPPPTPTWGQMLSGSGAQYMLNQPGMAFWPGFTLAAVVFGFNMLGDALRDVLDPRLRGGR